MRYTVGSLHKALGKLIKEGHARKQVLVDKSSFQHNCEDDGVVVLELSGLGIECLDNADDDGGTKFNKDGSVSSRRFCVLVGDLAANMKGEVIKNYA